MFVLCIQYTQKYSMKVKCLVKSCFRSDWVLRSHPNLIVSRINNSWRSWPNPLCWRQTYVFNFMYGGVYRKPFKCHGRREHSHCIQINLYIRKHKRSHLRHFLTRLDLSKHNYLNVKLVKRFILNWWDLYRPEPVLRIPFETGYLQDRTYRYHSVHEIKWTVESARHHNLHSFSVFPLCKKKVGSFHGRNAFGSMKHILFRRGNSSKRAKKFPFDKRTRPVDHQNGVLSQTWRESVENVTIVSF